MYSNSLPGKTNHSWHVVVGAILNTYTHKSGHGHRSSTIEFHCEQGVTFAAVDIGYPMASLFAELMEPQRSIAHTNQSARLAYFSRGVHLQVLAADWL